MKGFNQDYLSKDKTNSIKGIFILLIVLSHALPDIRGSGYGFDSLGDNLFVSCLSRLSQLLVVMFLFYSGYGVSESFKRKGKEYVHTFLQKRILTTLLNFDVAVLVFIVLGLFLSSTLTVKQCVLSLTGWESVGNSNWYIFVILLCYLMTYLVMRLPISKSGNRVILLFAMSLGSILLLACFKEDWWYNTLLCYPLGFMYSSLKEPVESFIKKHYWIVLLVVIMLFAMTRFSPADSLGISYNLMSMLFAIAVVIVTMKVGVGNPPLRWLGKNLFPIYIYMRIPMIVMDHKWSGFVGTQPALFIIVSLIVTLLITRFYKHWQISL